MILKVSGFDLKVEYLPGKKQILADTLSRASLDEVPAEEDELQVNMVERISISETKYAELQQNTANELHALYSMIQVGWPETKQHVPHSIRQYWHTRDELAILDGVIYRGMRIVIPPSMRPAMLAIIHGTHLEIVKCKQRAREALYWPGMSAQIEEKVKDCTICHDYAPAQQKEPLIPSPISDLQWAMAASDIFTFEGEQFLVLVDYYSKYIEVTKLKDLTSQETIQALEEHFGRHGIPARLITDCGVQYTSKEFTDFAKSYNFEHVLVSPKHPQANGEADAAVETVKSLWRKSENKNKALLDYRATPIPGIGLSPSQLCMGCRLRTTLPMATGLLKPETYNAQEIKRSFHASPRSPRSYVVDTGSRRVRRNRVALRADRPESHAGYQRRHASTLQQPEPEQESDTPDTDTAPQPPSAETLMRNPVQVCGDGQEPTVTEGSTRKDPAAVPQRSEVRGSAPYETRSGRQVRKPVKLDL